MPLFIVESPAKCKKIQGFLGSEWRVLATMGHIRTLQKDLDAIGLDRDFEPKYEWMYTEKSKAISQIREAASDYAPSDIYLASDDDREGEAISYSVCTLLRLDPLKINRVVFHEITASAIRLAVSQPRHIDMNKVMAQQTRAMLDMLIGFTMSPLLWKRFGYKSNRNCGLSAGRCQIPALRLIVERENTIMDNNTRRQSEDGWSVSGSWSLLDKSPQGIFEFSGKLRDCLEDEESAINYLEIHSRQFVATIIENNIKNTIENAPKPLITSTLQQQASAMFHCGPTVTMKIAQTLYEAGHITYMRTDHDVLSQEAIQNAHNWILHNLGKDYVGHMKMPEKIIKNTLDKTKTQNISTPQAAHEAIRPTHFEMRELQGEYSPLERKIYGLIWQRAVQSTMSACQMQKMQILFEFDDEHDNDFIWESECKRTIFPGWKKIGRVADIDIENDDADLEDNHVWKMSETLCKGKKIIWTMLNAAPNETRPISRFTEATLVRELEKKGIGRPSTFATLISTIQERGYAQIQNIPGKEMIVKSHTLLNHGQWPPLLKETKKNIGSEKNKLVPTEQGIKVLEYLLELFSDLFEYEFTANMEKKLDKISEGEEFWKEVLRSTWENYKDRYEQSKKLAKQLYSNDVKNGESEINKVVDGIEWDGKPVIKKKGPYGYYVSCSIGNVSILEKDDTSEILKKISAKVSGNESGCNENILGNWTNYVVRKGPYGPYILKKGLKKAIFVKLLDTVDVMNIHLMSEKDIETLYKSGLEKRKSFNKSQISRGGHGGRGKSNGSRRGGETGGETSNCIIISDTTPL